ncbi:MAG TPA: acetate--CoA ligase family protein, partial [Elusimicrobiota bacterium]|nr:acetate--CoA ligase family protein [Elusimicrobiota bacterium]
LPGQNASFGATPLPGALAFLSQSGAMITGGEDLLRGSEMGFRAVFSLGNKTNVDEADLLRMLGDDPQTRAIIGYLEDVKDGAKFLDAARAVSARKPVILLRTGRTSLGEAASAAHTAAIGGGTYGAFEAACDEAGVILVDSTRDLFELAKKLERGEPVSQPARAKRAKPAARGEAGHPAVDVVGDARADRYQRALDVLSAAPEVSAMVVVVSPQTMTEVEATAQAALEAGRRSGKPVIPVLFGGNRMTQAMEAFQRAGLPAFLYPEDAIDHLKSRGIERNVGVITNAGGLGVQITDYATERGVALARYSEETTRSLEAFLPPASNVHSFYKPHAPKPPAAAPVTLSESEAAAMLERAGIPYPRRAIGQDLEQLVLLARAMDFGAGKGVVLKAMSPDIDHAVKVGGIAMRGGKVWFIRDEAELREAFASMKAALGRNVPDARIEGYQISQVVQGAEIILGAQRDPVWGVVLTMGAGGSKVEEMDDAVKAVLSPSMTELERLDALRKRFSRLKVHAELLRANVDVDAVLRAALRLYDFLQQNPSVRHVDVNPVKIEGSHLIAVDAWIQLDPAGR